MDKELSEWLISTAQQLDAQVETSNTLCLPRVHTGISII